MQKTVVNSWNEWDPLRHVIVGRADNCHIPPEEPAPPVVGAQRLRSAGRPDHLPAVRDHRQLDVAGEHSGAGVGGGSARDETATGECGR